MLKEMELQKVSAQTANIENALIDVMTNVLTDDSYGTKKKLDQIVKGSKLTKHYDCKRRYDTLSERFREGPIFTTQKEAATAREKKPGILRITHEKDYNNPIENGLLMYFSLIANNADEINLSFVKGVLDTGVDINFSDEYGQTILHAIVRDWRVDIVEFAIEHNADVNIQDDFGRAPLHLAAALNCPDIINVLIAAGANPDVLSHDEKQTPLHIAAKYNSEAALESLIANGASLSSCDFLKRTPLLLAAEKGSQDTVEALLEVGAPSAVFDVYGNLALSYLAAMPHAAYHALDHHILDTGKTPFVDFFLNSIEINKVENKEDFIVIKSPLEMIISYDSLKLIMHPFIRESIDVKWNLFGRKRHFLILAVDIFYAVCWYILAYTFSDNNEYYFTRNMEFSAQIWKVPFELFVILFSIYSLFSGSKFRKKLNAEQAKWRKWRKKHINSQYIYCHPTWPNERKRLREEHESLQSLPSHSQRLTVWLLYEWITFSFIIGIIVSRVFAIGLPDSRELFLLHKIVFVVTMLISSLRLLRTLSYFRNVYILIKMSSKLFVPCIQIFFLAIQIFVPFVAFYWLLFRDSDVVELRKRFRQTNVTKIKTSGGIAEELSTVWWFTYYSLFKYDLGGQSKTLVRYEAQTYLAIFQLIANVILTSYVVVNFTSRFTTNYEICEAEAYLQQAYFLINQEQSFSNDNKMKIKEYFERYCNPLKIRRDYVKRTAKEVAMNIERKFSKIKRSVDIAIKKCADLDIEWVKGTSNGEDRRIYRNIVDSCLMYRDNLINSKRKQNDMSRLVGSANTFNGAIAKIFVQKDWIKRGHLHG